MPSAGPRLIKRLAASLAIGVVITSLLSGPAYVTHLWLAGAADQGQHVQPDSSEIWPSFVRYRPSLFGEQWHFIYPTFTMLAYSPSTATLRAPDWVWRPDAADRERYAGCDEFTTIAAGWPYRAFRATEWLGVKRDPGAPKAYMGYIQDSGWCLQGSVRAHKRVQLVIPYSPIWPGLLANLAIWSATAGVVITLHAYIRGSSRRRRSLCTACAYSRKGLSDAAPCPECGAAA